jgi:hypothetical protein
MKMAAKLALMLLNFTCLGFLDITITNWIVTTYFFNAQGAKESK